MYRLLISSWSGGDELVSAKALSVLTRTIIGDANPSCDVLNIEALYAKDIELNMRAPLWRQLLKDRQIHLLHDVLILGSPSCGENGADILKSSIDLASVEFARVLACRGILQLTQEENVGEVHKAALEMCSVGFMNTLEEMMPNSPTASKLLQSLFLCAD